MCVTLDNVGNYTCHAAQIGKQDEEVFGVAWLDLSGKYKVFACFEIDSYTKNYKIVMYKVPQIFYK